MEELIAGFMLAVGKVLVNVVQAQNASKEDAARLHEESAAITTAALARLFRLDAEINANNAAAEEAADKKFGPLEQGPAK